VHLLSACIRQIFSVKEEETVMNGDEDKRGEVVMLLPTQASFKLKIHQEAHGDKQTAGSPTSQLAMHVANEACSC
jgi:hypothetical protein